jgi:7-carboxy-7-deazaguanine synthase
MPVTLSISEIFLSVQGESTRAGLPCAFVRLAGCDVGCRWCDTTYARQGGEKMELPAVLARVQEMACPLLEVTGGEPLAQPEALELLKELCDAGYEVLLETSGTVDIAAVDPRVVRIVDVKCPSSGVTQKMLWENLRVLRPRDEVKIVLADRADYDFAKDVIARYDLTRCCTVLLGAVAGSLSLADLAAWILADRLAVRLNVQLHKMIWPAEERGR